ncbi:hypothetical protein L218DRAFT_952227 [Marasmius fiardii PR-910]|nr:hypothetical protein L218DRAFT_952227 [Marasmius fiardii PR-910]
MPSAAIPSLYRSYLRQINRLPVEHLRIFFRIKAKDDLEAVIGTKGVALQQRKLKRVSKDIAKVKAACEGGVEAFDHVLDLAYGRKGKMKRELIEPLLTDLNATSPPPIISRVPKSRPPVYSKELAALLTSEFSRPAGSLRQKHLVFPPNLPAHADPSSEEARFYGPCSKRREVNARWRYFTRVQKSVYPPLIISKRPSEETEPSSQDVSGATVQGSNIFEAMEAIVGIPYPNRQLTRRERKATNGDTTDNTEAERRHPSRWLRRRYQRLLGRTPVLNHRHHYERLTGNYKVELSVMSLLHGVPPLVRQPEVDADSLVWYELSKSSST